MFTSWDWGGFDTQGPGDADFQHWRGSKNGSAASLQVARNTGVGWPGMACDGVFVSL